ncbi:MAG: transcriptional regulator NrdR [Gallionella sp.]|nr:transcriptional regulator NrdR [Gallionella sp.]
MKCPFCKGPDTHVVDTRESEDGDRIRRRRRCLACDKRFTTFEIVELRMPQVVKQNGMRSEFDEEKLHTSFKRALHKRPVSAELVDAAIDHVIQKLHALGEREVGSRQVGEMVMKELLKLDKVAYIRFASVYKSFQDVGDFTEAVEAVRKSPARRTTDRSGKQKT